MFKKLKNKTQEYIKHIKTMFYTKLAVSLRKKDDICLGYVDWYDQHSWFERKWFKHKLKKMIMKFLLDVWRKLGNRILFEFYTVIYIKDKFSFYEISFPIVIKDENIEHASQILLKICDDLKADYDFSSVNFHVPQLVINSGFVNEMINNFYLGVNSNMVGEIEFNIYHGKNLKPKNIGFITNDKKLIDELGTYKYIDTQIVNYKTINQLDNYLPPLEKFLVKIMLIDMEILPSNLTKEEQEDRIKYLMNYKPKQ